MIEKDYYSILGVVNMLRMGNMDDINIQGKKEMGGRHIVPDMPFSFEC